MTLMTPLSEIDTLVELAIYSLLLCVEFDINNKTSVTSVIRVVRNLLQKYQNRIGWRPNALFRERCAKYL